MGSVHWKNCWMHILAKITFINSNINISICSVIVICISYALYDRNSSKGQCWQASSQIPLGYSEPMRTSHLPQNWTSKLSSFCQIYSVLQTCGTQWNWWWIGELHNTNGILSLLRILKTQCTLLFFTNHV